MSKITNMIQKMAGKNTTEDRLCRGEITYEEAMDTVAANFMHQVMFYTNAHNRVKRDVDIYNRESVPCILKTIEEELRGDNPEDHELNITLLKTFKADYQDSVNYVQTSSRMSLTAATMAVIGAKRYCDISKVPYDKDDFIKRCRRPDILKKSLAEYLNQDHIGPSVPSPQQTLKFYELVEVFEKALNRAGGNMERVDCFNEKGLVIDENGVLAEEDIYENYTQVDYKGIV